MIAIGLCSLPLFIRRVAWIEGRPAARRSALKTEVLGPWDVEWPRFFEPPSIAGNPECTVQWGIHEEFRQVCIALFCAVFIGTPIGLFVGLYPVKAPIMDASGVSGHRWVFANSYLQEPPAARRVELRVQDEHLLVDVGPATLALDTGFELTALFGSAAEGPSAAFSIRPHRFEGFGDGEAPSYRVALHRDFVLGDLPLPEVFVGYLPQVTWFEEKMDGVLGWSVFESSVVVLDFRALVLEVHNHLDEVHADWLATAQPVPLQGKTRQVHFIGEVGERDVLITLDTGAFCTSAGSSSLPGLRGVTQEGKQVNITKNAGTGVQG
jgi:hypothetical protein